MLILYQTWGFQAELINLVPAYGLSKIEVVRVLMKQTAVAKELLIYLAVDVRLVLRVIIAGYDLTSFVSKLLDEIIVNSDLVKLEQRLVIGADD